MFFRKIFQKHRNQCLQRLFLRVHFLRFILLIVAFSAYYQGQAQDEPARPRRGSRIIDDTTKQVYGPKTSQYYFEKDVFYNRTVYYRIDTLIRNFHRFNYVQQNENLYQDLGNIGTAIRPIYYQTPDVIGVRSGFNVYDMYWDAEQIKYYDTKSPYTNMKVVLAGKGRSITRATFSRNITPLWNFGFTYRGMFIDKQIQRQAKGDRNVRSNYYDFYTAYQSKDSAYRVFFNFRRQNHVADEYGGIFKTESFLDPQDYYDIDAQPLLQEASTQELRMNVHLFHQYEIGQALQVYHVFDRSRKGNDFINQYERENETNRNNYYGKYIKLEGDTTLDNTKFKVVRNEVGIKGNISKLFYNGYYALRDYKMHYKYIPGGVFYQVAEGDSTITAKTNGTETYFGGRMSLKLDSLVEVNGWAEATDNAYRIQGEIKSKWFEASVKQMQYQPSFLAQAYRGAHGYWNNNFGVITASQLNGYLHYNSRVLNVSPGLTLTRLNNYVFFKQAPSRDSIKATPVQSSGQQVIISPEFRLSLTLLKHIYFRTNIIYSELPENSDNAIQIPKLFVNGQLAYENIFFNGNLDMHAGVDVHWRSAYYALAYYIPIQQFYVQDQTQVGDFPLVDVFFNAKIKRGRIFLKYNNLLQAFTKQGYMLTPEYPGQRNVVDFGFDWSFYD